MVNRAITVAHYGWRDWLVQRISAVVIAVYVVLIMGLLLLNLPLQYDVWKNLFAHQWMRVFTLIALLSLFLHAWVGMRDIVMDYVHPSGLRLALYVIIVLSLVVYAAWSVQILWGA